MNSVKLSELKAELLVAAMETEETGLCRHKTGNLSVINREEGYIVITPSGIAKEKLEMSDFIVCDMNGNVLKNPREHKPSIETDMHLACYRKRPDIKSVVHTHSTFASAFAVNEKEIPPVLSEADFYNRNTKVVPFAEPGSKELAANAESVLDNDTDVLLLSKHGVLVVGGDISDTLLKATYVEEVAKVACFSTIMENIIAK